MLFLTPNKSGVLLRLFRDAEEKPVVRLTPCLHAFLNSTMSPARQHARFLVASRSGYVLRAPAAKNELSLSVEILNNRTPFKDVALGLNGF